MNELLAPNTLICLTVCTYLFIVLQVLCDRADRAARATRAISPCPLSRGYYVVDAERINVAHVIWTDSLVLQDESVLDVVRDLGYGRVLCYASPSFYDLLGDYLDAGVYPFLERVYEDKYGLQCDSVGTYI